MSPEHVERMKAEWAEEKLWLEECHRCMDEGRPPPPRPKTLPKPSPPIA